MEIMTLALKNGLKIKFYIILLILEFYLNIGHLCSISNRMYIIFLEETRPNGTRHKYDRGQHHLTPGAGNVGILYMIAH